MGKQIQCLQLGRGWDCPSVTELLWVESVFLRMVDKVGWTERGSRGNKGTGLSRLFLKVKRPYILTVSHSVDWRLSFTTVREPSNERVVLGRFTTTIVFRKRFGETSLHTFWYFSFFLSHGTPVKTSGSDHVCNPSFVHSPSFSSPSVDSQM